MNLHKPKVPKWDEPLITLDVDWAPDFVIDWVAERLVARLVRATWFITHASPAIDRLRQHPDLFELGIHPNFLPGSTHGDTPEAVLRHCMDLVPEAVSMRTHSLVQSSPLLELVMHSTLIKVDSSLFLPGLSHLRPFEYRIKGRTLWRIPFCWEDDFEMEKLEPIWRFAPHIATGEGLKVFNFHPIHIYLNSADIQPYQALKRRAPALSQPTQSEANAFVNVGIGTRTLFLELIEYLADKSSQCVRELVRI